MTESVTQAGRCARHPNVETNLRCGRCNDLICPRCLVQTPVGARCPDCARVKLNPAFDVSGATLMLSILGAVAAATFAWLVYLLIVGWVGFLGFVLWIVGPLAIGYGVAEATYRASGYRRNPRLQWIAGGAVVIGFAVAFLAIRAILPQIPLTASLVEALVRSLLSILIAAAMAAYRTRV